MKKLTVTSIKSLFPAAGVRKYGRNQIICYPGDRPHHIFFVLDGYVKLYDIDEEGNEKILHINGPQNIFPMLYAFGVTEEISAFYASIDPVELLVVPLKDFHKAVQSDIKFSNALTEWFLTEIHQLVYRINSFEKTGSKVKIMYALKYLAENYGHAHGRWQKVDLPITQQFIANITGLTRETVSSTMHDLEENGVIKTGKLRSLEIKQSELAKIT